MLPLDTLHTHMLLLPTCSYSTALSRILNISSGNISVQPAFILYTASNRVAFLLAYAAVCTQQVLVLQIATLRNTHRPRRRHVAPRERCTGPPGFIDTFEGMKAAPDDHGYPRCRPNSVLELLLSTLPVTPPDLGVSCSKDPTHPSQAPGHVELQERVGIWGG